MRKEQSQSICAVCFNKADFKHDIVCNHDVYIDQLLSEDTENKTNLEPIFNHFSNNKIANYLGLAAGEMAKYSDINTMSALDQHYAELCDYEGILDSVSLQIIRKQCQNCESVFLMNIAKVNPLDEIRFWKKFREKWENDHADFEFLLTPYLEEYENEEYEEGALNYDKFRDKYFGNQHVYEYYKKGASYFVVKSIKITYYRNIFIKENLELCEKIANNEQKEQLDRFWDRVYEPFYEFSSNFLNENYISCTILCRTISDLIFMLYAGDTSKYITDKNGTKVDHLFGREFVSERDKKMFGQINSFGNRGAHDGGSADREVLIRQITFLKDFLLNMTKYDIIENEYEIPEHVMERLKKLKFKPIHSLKEAKKVTET